MQNQENRPPAAPAKEAVPFGSPKPLPVKNTFIHYGTPIRHGTGLQGTPKTVPPNFAPEIEPLDVYLAPFPGGSSGSAQVGPMASPAYGQAPMASPMPNTGGRPAPGAWRDGVNPDAQTNRGRGVAPLRLFDFLPSPTVQAHPMQILQMPTQAPQVPANTFMHPPPPPAVPSSMGGQAPIVYQTPSWLQPEQVQAPQGIAPAPTYAPMAFESLQAQSLQSVPPVSWPSWNTTTATVQLPSATAHCLGPVNNPVVAAGQAPGMSMQPCTAGGYAVAPQMFMAAPMAAPPAQPPVLPPSKP